MEHVEVIKDQFTDYKGEIHQFIVAAVSTTEEDWEVNNEEEFAQVYKVIKLGVSICNPRDEFDENKGVLKATGRARKSDPVIFTTVSGIIGKEVVQELLKQAALHIAKHPEDFINGYAEASKKYTEKLHIECLVDNLSPTEKIVLEECRKNPCFLDNVNEILSHYHKSVHNS